MCYDDYDDRGDDDRDFDDEDRIQFADKVEKKA